MAEAYVGVQDEQATPSKAGQAATAGFAEVAHDESPDHLPVENGEDDRETQTYAKKTVRCESARAKRLVSKD